MKTKINSMKKLLILFLSLSLVLGFTSCRSLPTETHTDAESTISTAPASSSITDTLLTVKCFDVGKGDAFLLTTKNSAVMIDTGYKDNGDDLVEAVKNSGHDHLDMLIISHFDKDHVGGASKIVKNLEVDRILTTRVTNDSKRTTKFLEALGKTNQKNEVITEDTEFSIDNVTYFVDAPKASSYIEKEDNNSSLLVKATIGTTSMLFTGDAEDERLSEILKLDNLRSTILKMPHHGRYFSLLPDLVKSASPRYALITASDEEPEDLDTTSLLDSAGVNTYNTRNGDITITLDGESVGISQ